MSGNKIYVGNLSWEAREEDLRESFGQYGNLTEVKIITDRDTGRSKGFAFITFENSTAADQAVDGMFDKEICGRPVRVSIAQDKPRREAAPRDDRRSNYRDNRY